MSGMKKKTLALICTSIMVISLFALIPGGTVTGEEQSKEVILVESANLEDVNSLEGMGVEILDQYGQYTLINAEEKTIDNIQEKGYQIDTLSESSEIHVKGHTFDIEDKEPDLDGDMSIENRDDGEEGIHIINTVGPVNPEWIEILEEKGVEIINYVPNYAFEVIMTPEQAEQVEELFFVDWVGIYQPEFKMHSQIEEAMDKDMALNVRLRPGFEPGILNQINTELDVLAQEDLREDGYRLTVNVDSIDEVKDLAVENDVYYISPYVEPELHGEIDAQIIGGGAWIMDDEHGTPDEPYRKHGNYGGYINQIGYTGQDVTVAVADTGVGDGTTGDAGHPDFTDRVIDGYGFNDEDEWQDGHGHGTHVLGSAAGDTHHGGGEEVIYEGVYPGFAPYYMGQGLASESEIFSTKIFDDGGAFLPEEYYPIVEIPAQESDTYVHMNSWGAGTRGEYSDSDEAYDQLVRDADRDTENNEEMVITSSAGNDGQGGEQTTGSPGHAKNVISVGATETYKPDGGEHGGSNTDNPDMIADFSSQGWTEDNRIKPDVVAPGDNIISTASPEAHGEPTYSWMSGTSMSNPAVAGAAAVVVEWYEENFDKTPSPAMVRSLLINTAEPLDEENGNTGSVPNRKEGWGMVDISKLEYPYDSPIQFTLEDQDSLLTTGEVDEHLVSPMEDDEPLKITVTWTDENALAGDSEGGTPTLKNNLDLEVETPDGEIIRGNSFDLSGDGESDDGYTYPEAEVMDDFDYNEDGWDDVNNVQNVFIPPEELEDGAYTVRVKGTNVPSDANNDGQPNQDYALSVFNTEPPSDGIIRMDSDRYALEDEVGLTVLDGELGEEEYIDIGIYSDTDPEGLNWTLQGSEETFEFTGEVPISESEGEDVLKVSHGDSITAEYWDEDIGDGTGSLKTTTAYVDGESPYPPLLREVDWYGFQEVDSYHDDVEDGDKGYTIEKSHTNASDWGIRSNDASVGNHSWDFGDGEYNKTSEYGMLSSLISPEIELEENADEIKLTFDHWRSFNSLFDGGNLKISTNGTDGPWEILEPEEDYDGSINEGFGNPLGGEPGWGSSEDWETVTFDLINYTGEDVHFRWDAGTEAHDDDTEEGWRIDDITVTFENMEGTQHNRLEWSSSPDEYVSQYNIYRAEDAEGPWDDDSKIDEVPHNINHYVDEEAGEVSDERWWYVVRAEKDVGNEDDNEVSLREPGGPDLDITAPEKNSIFTEKEVTVEWQGDDSIEDYEIRLNDEEPVAVGDETEYTLEDLTDSIYSVSVYGYNGEEEIGFDNTYFIVDTEPPDLSIKQPENDSYVSDPDVTIEWDSRDDLSGINYYEIQFEDEDWEKVEESEYTFYDLHHGETYSVSVRAWNKAGFSTTRSVEFTVDTESPEVEMISPGEGEIVTEEDLIAEWTGADDVSGVKDYILYLDDEIIYEGDAEEFEISELDSGNHTLSVKARDYAGNTAMDSISFTIDTVDPTLDILSPDHNEIFSQDNVELNWTGHDNITGIDKYQVEFNGQLIYEGESESYELVDLESGHHVVEITAFDNAGNEAMEEVEFIVDMVSPTVEITSPEHDSVHSQETVMVEWSGSDDLSGIDRYELKLNGELIYEGEEEAYELHDLEDGEHSVQVKAIDRVGQEGYQEINFMIDTQSPHLEISSPEDGEFYIDDEVMVEWSGSDDLSGIDRYELKLNGELTYEGESESYELVDLESGHHVVEITAFDNAGNEAVEEVEFIVDMVSPTVEITSPEQDSVHSQETVMVEWSGSDDLSGIDRYELKLNGELAYEGESESYELVDLDSGHHAVEITTFDNAGNEAVEEVEFIVDMEPPTVEITSPEHDSVHSEETVMVEWSGSDDLSGIDRYELKLNGDLMYEGDGETYELQELEDGEHTLEAIAFDTAGNNQTEMIDFEIETPEPTTEALPLAVWIIISIVIVAAVILVVYKWKYEN